MSQETDLPIPTIVTDGKNQKAEHTLNAVSLGPAPGNGRRSGASPDPLSWI